MSVNRHVAYLGLMFPGLFHLSRDCAISPRLLQRSPPFPGRGVSFRFPCCGTSAARGDGALLPPGS